MKTRVLIVLTITFTGALWSHLHGPKGDDEINIIEKRKNYGWPERTYRKNYSGTTITNNTALPGMEQPIHYWYPFIAPSGMAFITGDTNLNWTGNLLIGSLKFQYLDNVYLKKDTIV
jgi:glucose/arabinose dehydrogenase